MAKLTPEQKKLRLEERREKRRLDRLALQQEEERNQPHVKQMVLTIEWKKSRMWGRNPHLTADVVLRDGTRRWGEFTCGGCGYDKESTVIADAFNMFLKYKLWEPRSFDSKPYGICMWEHGRYYDGGIGTGCYYKISEFIGGQFKPLASTKNVDVWMYEDLD